MQTLSDQKLMNKPDFSDGISRFISFMPELSLDLPDLHKYVFNIVIKPLVDSNMMNLKYLRFDNPLPKPEDPDDVIFDASDYALRLLALIISDDMTKNPNGMNDFVKNLAYAKVIK